MPTVNTNVKPKDHKTLMAGQFVPHEKELVIDIDMTDYSDCRYCCQYALTHSITPSSLFAIPTTTTFALLTLWVHSLSYVYIVIAGARTSAPSAGRS